jgi:hypothetical protein
MNYTPITTSRSNHSVFSFSTFLSPIPCQVSIEFCFRPSVERNLCKGRFCGSIGLQGGSRGTEIGSYRYFCWQLEGVSELQGRRTPSIAAHNVEKYVPNLMLIERHTAEVITDIRYVASRIYQRPCGQAEFEFYESLRDTCIRIRRQGYAKIAKGSFGILLPTQYDTAQS